MRVLLIFPALALLFSSLLSFSSCKKEEENNPRRGLEGNYVGTESFHYVGPMGSGYDTSGTRNATYTVDWIEGTDSVYLNGTPFYVAPDMSIDGNPGYVNELTAHFNGSQMTYHSYYRYGQASGYSDTQFTGSR